MPRKKKPILMDPKNPDAFFAKPRFDDAYYVAEVLHLVRKLLLTLYASGVSSRPVEALQEEYDAAMTAHPELMTTSDPLWTPKGNFPRRGTVPHRGTIEISILETLEHKTLFLAHLLQEYARWLSATGKQGTAEYVASIVIGLRRLLNDNLDARVLAGKLNG